MQPPNEQRVERRLAAIFAADVAGYLRLMSEDEATGDDHMETMTLKGICAELKLDPRVAREKLLAAIREPKKYPNLAKAHKPRQPWQWSKGSPAEKEARGG